MAERYVSFRIGKETSLGSEVVPTENKNPFTDGTLIFAYNNKYNHVDISEQIVDGRLYVDAAIDGNNYRFPVNSECSYFLINKEDGKDFEMGNTGRPVYFSGGIPQPVDYISTAYGGTGLTSFTANRMVWTSSASELSTSGHYVDASHLAVNSETLPIYNFYVSGTSGFNGGHIYLAGANASSSINNTTQIVFGTPDSNHVALSSNTKALVINPSIDSTTNQIVLYLDTQSKFPSGITCGDDDTNTIGNINTNGDLIAAGGLSVGGIASLGSNLNVAGSTAMLGNITITNDNPYVKFVDTENSNQVYYIQGYQGKFAFGPTFDSAIQTDASGNMTLPSGATITPREDNTGSIGSADYEWNTGFFRNIQSEDTFNLAATSNVSFSSADGIIQFNQSGAESGSFNGSGELQVTTAVRPAARGGATSGSSTYAWGRSYTNYLYIRDDTNNYTGGSFYTTQSTSTASQPTYLFVGNATATGTAGSRYGILRLYATTAEYTNIRARSNPTYSQSTFYLPAGEAAGDSCYAVWNPNSATAVGGSGQPVYVDAAGKVIGITTLTSNYGGTGVNAHTANRLVWSTSDTAIQATDNHFVNATKLAVNSIDEPTHNFYVDGTSGFTDSLYVFNEGSITYKIDRKKAEGGGWAYAPFKVIGNDDGLFASIGVYGNADEFKYMYLGTGSYDDESTNVRITTAGSISVPGSQTITPRIDATGSVGTSDYEWNEGYFRSIKSGSTLFLTPTSTMYIDSGSSASIIFRPQGTEKASFNTSGNFLIKTTTYAYNMLPATTNTYALGNSNYCWGTAYLGTTYTYHIYPRTTGTYSLGSATAGWTSSYMNNLYIRDNTNSYTGGRFYTTSDTSTTSQPTYLTIGNSTATGTAGSRYGVLRIYSTGANYAQLQYNDVGSYGRLRLTNAKGNYYGLLLGAATSGMAVMSIDDSHQGLYQESNSKWIIYHNGAGSICIGGSITATNYPIVLNGATEQIGTFYSTGNIWGNHIYPNTDATYNLGSTSYRWNVVYGHQLYLSGTTDETMTAASTNPRITFCESTSTQPVHLIYTDYDAYRSPAGLKVIGGTSATPAWFEVEGAMFAGGYITSTVSGARFKANNGSRTVWFGSSVNGNYQGIYDETAGYYLIRNTDSTHAANGVTIGATTTIAGSLTLSGQVYRGGTSTSWINGRTGALVRTSTVSGYSATVSVKTTNGSWEIGAYDNSSYTDKLLFSYCTDTNYSAGTNSTTAQIWFSSGGMISCAVLKSSNYGTSAPGSSTAGYGTAGALYFKVIS